MEDAGDSDAATGDDEGEGEGEGEDSETDEDVAEEKAQGLYKLITLDLKAGALLDNDQKDVTDLHWLLAKHLDDDLTIHNDGVTAEKAEEYLKRYIRYRQVFQETSEVPTAQEFMNYGVNSLDLFDSVPDGMVPDPRPPGVPPAPPAKRQKTAPPAAPAAQRK